MENIISFGLMVFSLGLIAIASRWRIPRSYVEQSPDQGGHSNDPKPQDAVASEPCDQRSTRSLLWRA